MIEFATPSATALAGKIARYPLSILPRGMAVPVLQGPLRGKKWIIGSQRHACWLGSYESYMQKLIAREVKPGSVFYDAGANVGFYSLLGAILVRPGRVWAFEPLPANILFLRRHLELNRITNVDVLEVALSDEVGTAHFQSEETRAMGRLQADGDSRVRTTTLDAVLQQQQAAPPDSIKMDIEGAEFRALLGARKCFRRYRPKLFLATHGADVHDQCCRLLRSWDYEFRLIGQPSADRAEIFGTPLSHWKKFP